MNEPSPYSHAADPDDRPRSRLTTFRALDCFWGGIGFIVATPGVWGLAAVPAVILAVLTGGLTVLGVWGATELGVAVFGTDRGTWGAVGYWTLTVLLAILGFLIALLVALALTQPLSGFALERIAQAQERKLTGSATAGLSFIASLWLDARSILFVLATGGTALVVLFLVNLVFPPAVVVTVPLKLLVCAWMIAWDLLDYPLGLRGLGVRARVSWVLRHFGAFTVFGMIWTMVSVVPGAILLLLPMGVAGATRMVVLDDPGRPNEAR